MNPHFEITADCPPPLREYAQALLEAFAELQLSEAWRKLHEVRPRETVFRFVVESSDLHRSPMACIALDGVPGGKNYASSFMYLTPIAETV